MSISEDIGYYYERNQESHRDNVTLSPCLKILNVDLKVGNTHIVIYSSE